MLPRSLSARLLDHPSSPPICCPGLFPPDCSIIPLPLPYAAQVSFRQGSSIIASVPTDSVNATLVTATLPVLPAGAYTVVLYRSNGEASVADPSGTGTTFLSQPFITALVDNIGSLAGGNVLTVLTNATVCERRGLCQVSSMS